MPCRFLVVCEAEADFRMVSRLVDRVICEHVDWMDEDQLEYCPIWFELNQNTPFLKWSAIKDVATREGIPAVRGEFGGQGGAYDAQNTIRVLRLFKRWQYQNQDVAGVLLVRDHDGLPERLDWLFRARNHEANVAHLVVIGVAQHERECWMLAGYVPSDQEEQRLIADIRSALGFDPCADAHRLTARADHEVRSAKRVLGQLTQHRWEREEACWTRTPLATLRGRGGPSGLAAFLAEAADRLVPLFTRRRSEESPTAS